MAPRAAASAGAGGMPRSIPGESLNSALLHPKA